VKSPLRHGPVIARCHRAVACLACRPGKSQGRKGTLHLPVSRRAIPARSEPPASKI